ncbi:23S rRNA (pseudouridine(1915)-N(3))-methyltransferase RlmH [Candidatus Venteria ishoeyi]|uniref:Ribosomal RNA large subunit methyltransferase H n=1 Tax=Candidatus Venteria ishoeyi TaxID=1899563 RepID=A0A1H6FAK2_9GAMM|nr:23S rRNA (pseudouridine(1915)-N(3))-methyltransferase RlmH [Candidatus Venteria ishoeyi]SEH06319.1 Ribosomal RNA large subunit methyltransferase H [Candidatus Venteria ishoeyi]
MVLHFICIGQRMPAWITQGYTEYAKRLPRHCQLKLVEIPLRKRGKNADIKRFQAEEGRKMLAEIPPGALVIALDEHGKHWDTKQFSKKLGNWMEAGRPVALLVGGPEGLAPECKQRAELHWSLSALTLPHPLVRVVVAEQVYRGWTLLNNHPYHRD